MLTGKYNLSLIGMDTNIRETLCFCQTLRHLRLYEFQHFNINKWLFWKGQNFEKYVLGISKIHIQSYVRDYQNVIFVKHIMKQSLRHLIIWRGNSLEMSNNVLSDLNIFSTVINTVTNIERSILDSMIKSMNELIEP